MLFAYMSSGSAASGARGAGVKTTPLLSSFLAAANVAAWISTYVTGTGILPKSAPSIKATPIRRESSSLGLLPRLLLPPLPLERLVLFRRLLSDIFG